MTVAWYGLLAEPIRRVADAGPHCHLNRYVARRGRVCVVRYCR